MQEVKRTMGEETRQKYDPDNLFKENMKENDSYIKESEKLPIEVKKENWFEKIINLLILKLNYWLGGK